MAKKKKEDHLSSTEKISIGVGLTATAVAAAGAYFLYGSEKAAKNRKKVKSWMLKAKAEVLEKLEDAKEMTQEEYEEVINAVAGTYSDLKSATKVDVKSFKEEMKDYWNGIEKSVKPKKKVVKKAPVKKIAKKTPTKKAVKKTPVKKATKKATKKK